MFAMQMSIQILVIQLAESLQTTIKQLNFPQVAEQLAPAQLLTNEQSTCMA
jgi:hypothetical protein